MSERFLVEAVNDALHVEMERDPSVLVMGEDVGRLGGVFRATAGLQERFGADRCVDTPLAEAGILGAAVGLCLAGWRPVCEMQYDAFSYPALDQLINHVGRYRWRTRGAVGMPLTIRMPYGGGVRAPELHDDSPETYYVHTPGVKVAIPSTPADAKGLLAAAIRDPDPVVVLEPKLHYRTEKEEVPDGEHLVPLGVDMVQDLPGVGENLQDHLEVYIQYASLQPVSIVDGLKWHNRPLVGLEWLFRRTGTAASNHFEAGGFCRSNEDVDWPNLMFHFLPIAIRYDGSAPEGQDKYAHGYQVHIGPMYADTRGWVRISSTDPRQKPRMLFNYLSTPTDRKEWVEVVRVARDILNQPAFAPFNGGELSPGPSVETDEEILDWVRKDAETALHPSCTARMGTDDLAVTDPTSLRVHGTEGLRVVDASVFPFVTNGNIYAPVMMVAEKAADLILGNTPLAPADVPYYRHRDQSPLYPPGDPRNAT